LAKLPTERVVKLRSPFNGEVFQMKLVAGTPPTLETLLAAKFELVDDEPPQKVKRAEP
jgi:hypothetical protein